MQNIRLLMGLALAVHGIIIGAQCQVLDAFIQVKLARSFRKGSIPNRFWLVCFICMGNN
jgi:hypothetical protein